MGTVLGSTTRQQDKQGGGRPIGGTPGCWFPSQALQACGGELSPAAALERGWRVSGSRGIPANSWLVSGGRLPARGAYPAPGPGSYSGSLIPSSVAGPGSGEIGHLGQKATEGAGLGLSITAPAVGTQKSQVARWGWVEPCTSFLL